MALLEQNQNKQRNHQYHKPPPIENLIMRNIYLTLIILLLCASKILNHGEDTEEPKAIVQPLTNEMTITFIPQGE